MQHQRKLPSKRYSSYMPVSELSSLEDHVSALPPSSSRSDHDVVNLRKNSEKMPDKSSRRKSLNTLHFDALQNAVSKLSRIDDFHLEELGYGFFSDVFKVTHKQSGKVMVLKRNKDTNTKLNILREVQLMNRLSHPNILKFFGVCVHEGQLHALTEFINGGDLDQLVQQKNTVPLQWAVRISLARDIARGLQYLHSMGIFHRDVTAKNCLVRVTTTPQQKKNYSAVVADLGLAEKIPATPEQKEKLRTVGTPYCMAPEVLMTKPYDERSDFFSFGIIICQLIIRTTSDPDKLPRSNDFGVERDLLLMLIRKGVGAPELTTGELPLSMPPEEFLQLGYDCSEVDPAKRPTIKAIISRLEMTLSEEKSRTKKKQMSSSAPDSAKEGTALLCNDPSGIQTLPSERRSLQASGSDDNKENTSPIKSPPANLGSRRASCSRLSRSSSDVSNELISHAASIIASSQKKFFGAREEEKDMWSVVNSLNEAFVNPFSHLQKSELQERKLVDLPSSDVLEMTFDLPAPKLSSGSPRHTPSPHLRPKGHRRRQTRPKSLLLDIDPTGFTNLKKDPLSPRKLTHEPVGDVPKLSQLCDTCNPDSNSFEDLSLDLGQHDITDSRTISQRRVRSALIRSIAFSPQGRSLLSWWNNHCRISDWRSMAAVLSIMTDKMGSLKRSISLPDVSRGAGPLLALSSKTPLNSSDSRSPVSSDKGSPRSSVSGKPPSGSKFHPNAYPPYLTLPRSKKSRCKPCCGDRNRKIRLSNYEDVFTEDSVLGILHEETSNADLKHNMASLTSVKHCTCTKPPISPRKEINNNSNSKIITKLGPTKPPTHNRISIATQEAGEDFHLGDDSLSNHADGNVSSSSTSSGTSTSSGFKIVFRSGVVSSSRRKKVRSYPPPIATLEDRIAASGSTGITESCSSPDAESSPIDLNSVSKDSHHAPRSNRDSGYNEEVFSVDHSCDSHTSIETLDASMRPTTIPSSASSIPQSSDQSHHMPGFLGEVIPRCKIKECGNSNVKLVGKSH